jgi:hypothetical protein
MREVLAFSVEIIPENQRQRIGYQATLGGPGMGQRADSAGSLTRRYGVPRFTSHLPQEIRPKSGRLFFCRPYLLLFDAQPRPELSPFLGDTGRFARTIEADVGGKACDKEVACFRVAYLVLKAN